jgi:TatD DNase family protein
MALNIIDTHAHLDMPEFDSDREAVIRRAFDCGVETINTIGINIESCQRAVELAEKYEGIVSSVGFHPQETDSVNKEDVDKLAELAQHPRVVAIGEMGLDYYRLKSSRENQLKVLKWQLEVARKVGKPIIIHCREAQDDMLSVIQSWVGIDYRSQDKIRGVLHCFNGDLEIAILYINMGFFIALGAYIGYPSSARLRETVSNIPPEKLVIETDCPFLPPQKYRGQRNEPSYTTITLGVLAEVKKMSLEEMARQTTSNAKRLFNLPLRS